jgi:putative transposase
MQSRMTSELALQALLSAVWRRKPKAQVMIHFPSRDIAAQYPAGQWIKVRNSLGKIGSRFSLSTI